MSNDLQILYQDALDYLYSYIDFSLTHQQNLSPENFDLTRMFALMEALGNPQMAYPTLHVAGSKGKGSVSALCASALQAEGYQVGLYTSPHLKDFEERIQINGQPISQVNLIEIVEAIKPHVAAIPRLTTFEISTALAFWHFARQQVDYAVIEVGMGGRLDATNVVTPLVSVITTLLLEHTYVLGDTLSEIAAEKGGIIKPGVPVVLAPQADSAREVVARLAAERGSELIQLGEDYHYRKLAASLTGQDFEVWATDDLARSRLQICLLGPHQIENAAVAYATLRTAHQHGLALSDHAIARGFAETEWPGRFEVLSTEPPVIVDSAHTPGAVVRLQETLDEFFPQRQIILVLGVSEDKDIGGMLEGLRARLKKTYCAQSSHPRAMPPDALADAVRPAGKPVEVIADVGDALMAALQAAQPQDIILITGSIFVAASARIAWYERIHPEKS